MALDRFGESAIRQGRPLATLEEALVPLYLGHRYQVDAAAHLVGGVSYGYVERSDGSQRMAPVDARSQNDALAALLATVTPEALALPASLRGLIPPRPPGYWGTRELFDGRTGLTFDPVAPAETGAALTFGYLLDATRATRLAYQPALDASLLSFSGLLDRTTTTIGSGAQTDDAYHANVRQSVWTEWTRALMELSSNTRAASTVRATTDAHLAQLATDLSTGDDHARWLSRPHHALPRPRLRTGRRVATLANAAARLAYRQLMRSDRARSDGIHPVVFCDWLQACVV